jgi:hypothetical protein
MGRCREGVMGRCNEKVEGAIAMGRKYREGPG